MKTNVVRIALLGCGTVGASLLELLADQATQIARRQGLELNVAAIAVSDLSRQRPAVVPADLLSDDAAEIVSRDDVDVVVEVMGEWSRLWIWCLAPSRRASQW